MRPAAAGRDRPTVVVGGALAQRPGVGGHAWVLLSWLLGLRASGYQVLLLDRTEPEMLDDPTAPVEASAQWRWLRSVSAAAGLDGDVALLHDRGRTCLGLSRVEVLERVRRSCALLNVMGYVDDPEVLAAAPRRVFVDIDPGFPQLWRAQGLHDAFAGHDAVATVGLAVGGSPSTVPVDGLVHVPTVPPVVLDRWTAAPPLPAGTRPRVTSVATWRGPFGPLVQDGVRLGLRAHSMRSFATLPAALPGVDVEVALAIDAADEADAALLRGGGWSLVDPAVAAGDPESYRRYVRGSSAELVIAKELYVRTRGGWFSDRSACYLASGRPVVAQDTGFSAHLPTGEGLVAFATPDEAADAVSEVTGNPRRHGKAARDLAVDVFDATKVLPSLLARLGVA